MRESSCVRLYCSVAFRVVLVWRWCGVGVALVWCWWGVGVLRVWVVWNVDFSMVL